MSTVAACRIRGQERAIATLSRALLGTHLHHAWILHGPFGVGKCSTALEFARLLLDPASTREHMEAFAPPRGTRVQALIDAGSHPDLHMIRKERSEDSQIASLRDKKQTNIPIDLLRELMLGGAIDGRHFDGPVWRTAYLGHRKVFLIDEAELLDEIGQNALLKTLEEPPPGTYILLATTREDRLLPTIRSRCQRVGFAPLDADSMRAWLNSAELSLDGADREWVERFAAGSPGLVAVAAQHGVHSWARELAPVLRELSRGRFQAGLGDRMAELVSDCAERIVKENARASKEAANRLGVRLLFGVLGQTIRDGLANAMRDDDVEGAEQWTRIADRLAEADEQVRRHLNLKQVLACFAAQWVTESTNHQAAKAN